MTPASQRKAPSTTGTAIAAAVLGLLTLIGAQLIGEAQALGAMLFVFVLVVALHRYRYAVLLAVFLLPLSGARIIPREILGVTGLNPFNIALLASVLLILVTRIMQPQRLKYPHLPLQFWLYLACLLLATLNGMRHVAAIPAYFKALQVIAFDSAIGYVVEVFVKPALILLAAVLLGVAIRNAPRPRIFLVPLFCSAIILPLTVLADVALAGTPLAAMVAGGESFSGMHVNELGLMFNMSFALALFCFFSRGAGAWRFWLGVVLLILTAGVALTFSRGAYLGYLAVVAFFLFKKKRFDFMFLGVLLLPLMVIFLPQAVLQRASTGLGNGGDVDAISAGRVNDIWRPLLPELAASPVVGQGLSSVLWSEPAKTNNFFTAGRIGHPHSAYLGMLLDFGLAGAALICLFFRHMWRVFAELGRRHPEPIWRDFFHGAGACILVLMIQGVTDDRVTPTIAQSFLWLAYGIALGYHGRGAEPAPVPVAGRA